MWKELHFSHNKEEGFVCFFSCSRSLMHEWCFCRIRGEEKRIFIIFSFSLSFPLFCYVLSFSPFNLFVSPAALNDGLPSIQDKLGNTKTCSLREQSFAKEMFGILLALFHPSLVSLVLPSFRAREGKINAWEFPTISPLLERKNNER